MLSPKGFLHLGSRSAVDQAFCRFAKEGKLLRVARGIYTAPVTSRFGSRAPAPEKIVHALAEHHGEVVVPHGASAANALGLTQQVPVREVYLTSGRTHKLRLDQSEILVRHVPRWMLALGTGFCYRISTSSASKTHWPFASCSPPAYAASSWPGQKKSTCSWIAESGGFLTSRSRPERDF
ncbi:DUF6088 family protein [Castellaniella caeni]